jgi:hypothetical protein
MKNLNDEINILEQLGFTKAGDHYEDNHYLLPIDNNFEFWFCVGDFYAWGISSSEPYADNIEESESYEVFEDCLSNWRDCKDFYQVRTIKANFEITTVADARDLEDIAQWAEMAGIDLSDLNWEVI